MLIFWAGLHRLVGIDCEARRRAAGAIMEARQMVIPCAETRELAEVETGAARDQAAIDVRLACDQPVYPDDDAKRRAAALCGARAFGNCREVHLSLHPAR